MSSSEYEREAARILQRGPMLIANLKKELGLSAKAPCPELTDALKCSPRFKRRYVRDKSGNLAQEWSLTGVVETDRLNPYMLPWIEAATKKLEAGQCWW